MRPAGLLLLVLCLGARVRPAEGAPLRDAPVVWHEDDRRDTPPPRPREPNLV